MSSKVLRTNHHHHRGASGANDGGGASARSRTDYRSNRNVWMLAINSVLAGLDETSELALLTSISAKNLKTIGP